ncbi:hypothetical protein JQ596_12930 [Bradyrhizobium manausense]|nr:hypothetical protein [Bradyrhizobium manausense]UVO33557.1 hypothetical protein KUF59_41565 [Bradyrhizobium arachidis]
MFAGHEALASTTLVNAAMKAETGLSGCSNNTGKQLYNCVADVLDRMSGDIGSVNVPETQRALQTAASRLRAATGKAQAISAITQCQSVIAGALRKARAIGGAVVPGWGDSGLSAIVEVLGHAAKLIQTKG